MITKKILLTIFVLPILFGFGPKKEKTVSSKIDRVLVFYDGAQITRTARVHLNKGINLFYFDSLSVHAQENSVQLKNNRELTILGITYEVKAKKDKKVEAEIKQLKERQQELQYEVDYLKAQRKNYQDEYDLLIVNKNIRGDEKGVEANNLAATADFMRTRLQELLDKRKQIRIETSKIQDQIMELSKQLIKKKGKVEHRFGRVKVKVDMKSAAWVDFELSYLVDKANWQPAYDLRLKDITRPLDMTYKAMVFQETGIDWKDVKISLSNGTPTISNQKPELLAWRMDYARPKFRRSEPVFQKKQSSNKILASGYVRDNNGEPLPGTTIIEEGTSNGTVTDLDGRYELEVKRGSVLSFSFVGFEEQRQTVYSPRLDVTLNASTDMLDEIIVTAYGTEKKERIRNKGKRRESRKKMAKATARASYSAPKRNKNYVAVQQVQNQTTLQYDIKTRYAIKSGDDAFSVDIKMEEISAFYQYAAVPKLEKDAFLVAHIPSWANYNLLDGNINIYYEGTYMGTSFLKTDLTKDTMQISIGRDKNISISRTKLKDLSSRKLFGTKRHVEQGFEFTVRNNKKQEIKLILEDHYPVPAYKEIEVEELDHSGAIVDSKTKKLKWILKIQPNQTVKKTLRYSVKYPKSRTVYLE